LDIQIVEKKGVQLIDSKLLHKALEVASYHADWIRRRIDGYGFEEGVDYHLHQHSTLRGGTKRKEYLITLDMAKELAMLENNEVGTKTRRYFIQCEKEYRKHEAIRLSGIQIRKTLTDSVQESGENERMHGHGFSQYTTMVYEICGIKAKYEQFKTDWPKRKDFRDTQLDSDQLKRVELAESLIKPLLELEKQYSEIKVTLKPLFEIKK
jgi:phage anti-repressor protein